MSFRCVVIDDERPAREKIKHLLAGVGDFEVVGEAANTDDAVRLIDETKPDLCFLDVQMPGGDGFEVLRRVQELPNVIFTTAYDRYAVQAFDLRSLDYLLKPFGKARLEQALDRARTAMSGRNTAAHLASLLAELQTGLKPLTSAASPPLRISARKGNKILLLEPAGVVWFEAEDTLVFARTEGGRFLVERTLSDLEQQLPANFFRSHRRFLVNLGLIAEILPAEAGTYRIVMRDRDQSIAPLSRRQARKLKELIPW